MGDIEQKHNLWIISKKIWMYLSICLDLVW